MRAGLWVVGASAEHRWVGLWAVVAAVDHQALSDRSTRVEPRVAEARVQVEPLVLVVDQGDWAEAAEVEEPFALVELAGELATVQAEVRLAAAV